ncbi:hypothetical protein P4O66_012730 [Electrophorus voltai]|uniref:RING-type domain-containing protein n=1 Tax=Electrophorus voltai TaxID=2609070 RepID=A0AAD8Z5E2_9TELE|nr:hypothetical protein P4O66_012730 [Electrophorus voltai]
MTSDFQRDSSRMPNIGFQNLPLNIYIVVFGTAIFVFILSLLFCCYLIRLRHQAHKELYAYKQVIQKEKVKELNLHEICAVCLEEFKQKDELGICPCKHAFHRNVCSVCLPYKKPAYSAFAACPVEQLRPRNTTAATVPHQVVGGEEGLPPLQHACTAVSAAAGHLRGAPCPHAAASARGGEPGIAAQPHPAFTCSPHPNSSAVQLDIVAVPGCIGTQLCAMKTKPGRVLFNDESAKVRERDERTAAPPAIGICFGVTPVSVASL